MSNHDDQLPNSAPAPADRPHDGHRAIIDEWMQRVIAGIKEMHLSEDARRSVAKRLF